MRAAKLGWLLGIPIAVLGVGLRVYSLDADPDWRLDWNPGLLTDEAFYMHNARNQVLFGQANLDEFNNAVLSPLVHFLQVWVFSNFGVGYVQGRLVSVVLGLLSIVLLGRVLWLAFGGAGGAGRALPAAGWLAWGAMVYLAYEHLYLLYNRTALLETPAAFFCLVSLWCFAEAYACGGRLGAWLWALLAGGAAVLALATKLTTLPFVAALLLCTLLSRGSNPSDSSDRSDLSDQSNRLAPLVRWGVLLGALVGGALWYALWLHPHWDTWSHMQSFYARVQGLPHSGQEAWRSVRNALIGERYGLMQFLFLHAPLAWLGSLLLMMGVLRSARLRAALTSIEWVLLGWVLLSWLQMVALRIAPTRYTASFMPAMVALLWVAVARFEHLRPLLTERDGRSWLARTVMGAWIVYFLLLLALPGVEWRTLEFPVLNDRLRGWLLLVALLMAGIVAWYLGPTRPPSTGDYRGVGLVRWVGRGWGDLSRRVYAVVVLGVVLNTPWYWSYFSGRTYQLKAFNEALTRMLPPGSVLVGVAFETPFRYFFVFRGLCNDGQPPQLLGATHVLVVGSEETLIRFWTSGADLSRWYTVPARVEPAAHPMLRGRVGPYRLLVYALPRVNALGWRESSLHPQPRLAPNALMKPPSP
jgi:hypothetical protein